MLVFVEGQGHFSNFDFNSFPNFFYYKISFILKMSKTLLKYFAE